MVRKAPLDEQPPQTMNPSHEELLFGLVLTKPAAERALFLDRECGDDQPLRARLDALLYDRV